MVFRLIFGKEMDKGIGKKLLVTLFGRTLKILSNPECRLESIRNVDLFKYLIEMGLDRMVTDAEFIRNLSVREPLRYHGKDLYFSGSEDRVIPPLEKTPLLIFHNILSHNLP